MSGLDIPGCSYEYFGQSARVEAPADRARVLRLSRDDRGAERLEPVQPVIELLDDQLLEARIAGRAFTPESLEAAVAPDDPARQHHRAARPVAFLEHDGRNAELASARCSAQPGHAGAGDDQLRKGKAGFVLDVLDPHTLRAPEEDRVGVRRVNDVVDLDAELFSLGNVLLCRVHEHRQM